MLKAQANKRGNDMGLRISVYDDGVIEIEGVKYSHTFFKAFGQNGLPIGYPFCIVERNDGVVTIEATDLEDEWEE